VLGLGKARAEGGAERHGRGVTNKEQGARQRVGAEGACDKRRE
jgi:hypothetical protein